MTWWETIKCAVLCCYFGHKRKAVLVDVDTLKSVTVCRRCGTMEIVDPEELE